MKNEHLAGSIDWPDRYRVEMILEPCQSKRRLLVPAFDRLRANLQIGTSSLNVSREFFEEDGAVQWRRLRVGTRKGDDVSQHNADAVPDRSDRPHQLQPIVLGFLHHCRDIERNRVPEP